MNNSSITTESGKVSNINMTALARLKMNGKKVIKLLAISTVVVVVITGFLIFKGAKAEDPLVPLEDQNVVMLEEVVDEGETIYNIAQEYYNDACKDSYKGISDYVRAIMDQNNSTSNIYPNQVLSIPVIVDSNNPIYIEMQNIEKEIEKIKETDYWIIHEVKYGDSVSELAWLASGNLDDMKSVSAEIREKNGIDNILPAGTKILIVNPEIGRLRTELEALKGELAKSITNPKTK